MKEVERLKLKLKRTKWLHENMNKLILGIYTPLAIFDAIFFPIFPWLATTMLAIGCSIMFVLGPIYFLRYEDTEYLHLVERQLAAAETVNEEKLEVLSRTIDKYKDNPTIVKDKKTTKSLIKDLIKIKASAQKALEDQNQEEIIEKDEENSLNM